MPPGLQGVERVRHWTTFGGPRAAGRNQARHIASWLHETKMRRNKKDEKPFNFSSTVIHCVGRTDLILLGGILKHVQRHLAVRLSKVETQPTIHTPSPPPCPCSSF